ncbi:MAG: hypothetical protein NXI04_13835 [Planctomycetaceae bacterium]|nr:hypothetical protein [Planctomycetaceae bacterium]
MKTNDPFAAPQSVTRPAALQLAAGSYRVHGDLLVCGAEADLTAVCWYSGEMTTPLDRKKTSLVRLEHMPTPLRFAAWSMVALVLPLDSLMNHYPWTVFPVLCLLILLAASAAFLQLTAAVVARVTIASTRTGKRLRMKHVAIAGLQAVVSAAAVGSLLWMYQPLEWLIPFTICSIMVYLSVRLMWNKVVPAWLHVHRPSVQRFHHGVFYVSGLPQQFLKTARQLQKTRAPEFCAGGASSTVASAAEFPADFSANATAEAPHEDR